MLLPTEKAVGPWQWTGRRLRRLGKGKKFSGFWKEKKKKVRGENSGWKEKQRESVGCCEQARRELEELEATFKLNSSQVLHAEGGGSWLMEVWGSIEAQKAGIQIK